MLNLFSYIAEIANLICHLMFGQQVEGRESTPNRASPESLARVCASAAALKLQLHQQLQRAGMSTRGMALSPKLTAEVAAANRSREIGRSECGVPFVVDAQLGFVSPAERRHA